MAPRVLPHAFLSVDNQQGRFGPRGTRDHVLQKFNMAGSIKNNVITLGRFKKYAGRIDRDALRLLILQSVYEKSILEGLRVAAAVFLHLGKLALGQRACVGKQPPDDGAFAVVHMPGNYYIHFLLFKLLCHFPFLLIRSIIFLIPQ